MNNLHVKTLNPVTRGEYRRARQVLKLVMDVPARPYGFHHDFRREARADYIYSLLFRDDIRPKVSRIRSLGTVYCRPVNFPAICSPTLITCRVCREGLTPWTVWGMLYRTCVPIRRLVRCMSVPYRSTSYPLRELTFAMFSGWSTA